VKLFIRYQATDTWTTATGWLSRDDLVVTAAHCVLNGDQHATCVRVHIGYSASSEGTGASSDNQRSVARIALPSAWSDAKAEQSDIAFLQLDRPFQGVTPIKYDTPGTEVQQQLTVIGYPADLGARSGSPGGEMYYVKIRREIDLEPTSGNMLVYRGDSQGGKQILLVIPLDNELTVALARPGLSGAPIIRDNDFVAIGVHVRGGSFNFGAVIGGPFGVNFHVYEEALRISGQGSQLEFTTEVNTDINKEWLNYMHVH